MGRFRLNKLRMNLLWFNVFLILVLSAAVNGEPKPNPKPDPKAKPKPDPKADPKAQRVLIFPPRGRDFQYNDWVLADGEEPPPEDPDEERRRGMFYGGYGGYGGGYGRPYGGRYGYYRG